MTDPIADLLTRIRNGQGASMQEVISPSSRIKIAVCCVLKDEGYIEDFYVEKKNGKSLITIKLKYYKGFPVISKLERVSRPGRRVYKGKNYIPEVLGGLGLAVISTSKGIMSGHKASRSGHGGEVLFLVS